MTYKPSEHNGLKEDGEPDKRMQSGHVSGMQVAANLISALCGAFDAFTCSIRCDAFVYGWQFFGRPTRGRARHARPTG